MVSRGVVNEYRSFYDTYSQKLELACNCVKNNPCTVLIEDINNLKSSVINPLYSMDWDDSVFDLFIQNLDTCNASLDGILESINSNFKEAEKLYIMANDDIKDLKTKIEELENELNNQPNKQDYKKETLNELGVVTEVSYPGYQSAYDNWTKKCDLYNNNCSDSVTQIESLLDKLEVINGVTLQSFEETSSMLSLPTSKANNLVDYQFENNEYLVIDVPDGYQGVLKRIGKQTPDKCLDYSYRYANNIFANSSSEKQVTNPVGLTSSDPSEILQIAAQEILEGRPSVIEVNGKHKGGSTYSRHFVTVVGLKESADLSNLQQSDFLILDPAGANIKMLNTDMGSSLTTRFLLSGENATHRVNNTKYVISIYSDASRYTSSTCIQSAF